MAVSSGTNPQVSQIGVGPSVGSSTEGIDILVGSGAPTLIARKGSLYVNTAAATSGTRLYVNLSGTGTWSAINAVS